MCSLKSWATIEHLQKHFLHYTFFEGHVFEKKNVLYKYFFKQNGWQVAFGHNSFIQETSQFMFAITYLPIYVPIYLTLLKIKRTSCLLLFIQWYHHHLSPIIPPGRLRHFMIRDNPGTNDSNCQGASQIQTSSDKWWVSNHLGQWSWVEHNNWPK